LLVTQIFQTARMLVRIAGQAVLISIDGVTHYAHRLAWLYVHGEHPARQIARSPDRLPGAFLFRKDAVRRNRSGFKGVYRQRSKWAARIRVDGRFIYIGLYSTPEKAAAAYDEAARLHYGEFARTNEMLGLLPSRSPDCTIAATPAPQRQLRSEIMQSGADSDLRLRFVIPDCAIALASVRSDVLSGAPGGVPPAPQPLTHPAVQTLAWSRGLF